MTDPRLGTTSLCRPRWNYTYCLSMCRTTALCGCSFAAAARSNEANPNTPKTWQGFYLRNTGRKSAVLNRQKTLIAKTYQKEQLLSRCAHTLASRSAFSGTCGLFRRIEQCTIRKDTATGKPTSPSDYICAFSGAPPEPACAGAVSTDSSNVLPRSSRRMNRKAGCDGTVEVRTEHN
jgi:hypothetical protein